MNISSLVRRVLTLTVLPVASALAQSWDREASVEIFAGTAWSFTTPLTVNIPGQPSVRTSAHYDTRPFSDAPYYAVRLGVPIGNRRGAEAELIHHKLYLANPQPPIDWFQVSHGYNLVSSFIVPQGEGFVFRFALGFVVAHPEGSVGGRGITGGYHIAGVTSQIGLGRRYGLTGSNTAPIVTPEVKLTASWARVPFGDGSIVVPNVALHTLAGFGVRHRYGGP